NDMVVAAVTRHDHPVVIIANQLATRAQVKVVPIEQNVSVVDGKGKCAAKTKRPGIAAIGVGDAVTRIGKIRQHEIFRIAQLDGHTYQAPCITINLRRATGRATIKRVGARVVDDDRAGTRKPCSRGNPDFAAPYFEGTIDLPVGIRTEIRRFGKAELNRARIYGDRGVVDGRAAGTVLSARGNYSQ